jgi:hypothetical protein
MEIGQQTMNALHGVGIYTGKQLIPSIGWTSNTFAFVVDDYGCLVQIDRWQAYQFMLQSH